MPEVSPQPNQPAQPQVQSMQSKGVSWKKIIVSVVVIAVVAGIIAGGLYWFFVINEEETTTTEPTKVSTPSSKQATPSAKKEKDETADWKTYTSKDGVYSFKYPKDWELNDNTSESGSLPSYVDVSCGSCNTESNTINSFHAGGLIYNTLDEYRSNVTEEKNGIYDKKRTTLFGLEAIKAVQIGGIQSGGSRIVWFVVYKGKGYSISYSYPSLMNATKIEEFNQSKPDILSTFKFID